MSLTLAAVTLVGCTSNDDEPGTSLSSSEETKPRVGSPRVPDIQGVDLAKAIKRLRGVGLIADVSRLHRTARSYGRQLIEGYYQSHPRVVVVDYALSDSKTVLIERVACPSGRQTC